MKMVMSDKRMKATMVKRRRKMALGLTKDNQDEDKDDMTMIHQPQEYPDLIEQS